MRSTLHQIAIVVVGVLIAAALVRLGMPVVEKWVPMVAGL